MPPRKSVTPEVARVVAEIAEQAQDRLEMDFRDLMADGRVRNLVRWIRDEVARLHENPHREASPSDTAFNLGMHAVARRLDDKAREVAPGHWLEMEREKLHEQALPQLAEQRVQARQEKKL